MAMYQYFKRKERNSDKLPYYNLGLPSSKIKTANTLKFGKLPNFLSANISGYTVFAYFITMSARWLSEQMAGLIVSLVGSNPLEGKFFLLNYKHFTSHN